MMLAAKVTELQAQVRVLKETIIEMVQEKAKEEQREADSEHLC